MGCKLIKKKGRQNRRKKKKHQAAKYYQERPEIRTQSSPPPPSADSAACVRCALSTQKGFSGASRGRLGDRHGLSKMAVVMETGGINCQGVLQHARTSPEKVAPGRKMPPCLYRLSSSDDEQQSAAVCSFDPFRCTSSYILVSPSTGDNFQKGNNGTFTCNSKMDFFGGGKTFCNSFFLYQHWF